MQVERGEIQKTKKKKFSCRFSFRIIRKKLIQYELRNYGQLRLLDEGNENSIQSKILDFIFL
jgi:hypothetical protein